jgi:hypothetical protein
VTFPAQKVAQPKAQSDTSGLRVSRSEHLVKGLVGDGDVELNDLGDNFEAGDDEYSIELNIGYCRCHRDHDRESAETLSLSLYHRPLKDFRIRRWILFALMLRPWHWSHRLGKRAAYQRLHLRVDRIIWIPSAPLQ